MNIGRRKTVPHVGLWGPANPVPVGIWPGRRQSPQLILCGPGTESPPGRTDTSWPLILAPPPPPAPNRSSQVYQALRLGNSSEYPLHQSLECSGGVHQPEGHYPKFIEPSLRDKGRLFRSAASISTCQYPPARSRLQKNPAPPRVLRLSSMCGSG